MDNFYDQFSYSTENFSLLQNAMSQAMKAMSSLLDQSVKNSNLSEVLTYKTIPFQVIDATSACYSLEKLLSSNLLPDGMGITSTFSLSKKIEQWNQLSLQEKSHILDYLGYSILLVDIQNTDSAQPIGDFDIVSFELYTSNNIKLTRNIDYYYSSNKIYLLKETAIVNDYDRKTLYIKNICIDYNYPEKIIGDSFNILYDKTFTKTDYNETIKSFAKAALNGPQIKDLNESLNTYDTLSGIKVIDYKSADNSKKGLWGNGKDSLTQFDFVVVTPIEFIYKSEKLEYVRSFFSQIKPSFSNFVFSPELITKDTLSLKSASEIARMFFKLDVLNAQGAYDKIKSTDLAKFKTQTSLKDTVTFDSVKILNWDTAYRYDLPSNKYDSVQSLNSSSDKIVDKIRLVLIRK